MSKNGHRTKKEQLGMDPGTASHRLLKDLLWKFVVETGNDFCHQCGAKMCRDSFSVEHITPWLHSESPLELFFDLNNISFSHKSCNYAAARKQVSPIPKEERGKIYSRRKYYRLSEEERRKRRRERYLRTGN